MPRHSGDDRDVPAYLEEPRNTFMAEIVEMEILDPEHAACPREGGTNRVDRVRENAVAHPRHAVNYGQRFERQIGPDVVTILLAGMLHVPDKDAAERAVMRLLEIGPADAGDLLQPTG